MQLNASRLKVLQAQAAVKELIGLSSDTKTYQKLLQGQVVQHHLEGERVEHKGISGSYIKMQDSKMSFSSSIILRSFFGCFLVSTLTVADVRSKCSFLLFRCTVFTTILILRKKGIIATIVGACLWRLAHGTCTI